MYSFSIPAFRSTKVQERESHRYLVQLGDNIFKSSKQQLNLGYLVSNSLRHFL